MRPTAHQIHAYDRRPHCATILRGGTVRRTREVIALVPGQVEVTAHAHVERRCARCGGRWQPGPDLDGAVLGQGWLDVGLLSPTAVLPEELRLPIERIQWYLSTAHGLALTVGANGYAWTFSTETARVFTRGGRDRTVLQAAIGPDYAGVLVSDVYATYTGYEGRHQYCRARLLRDVHDLVSQQLGAAGVRGTAAATHVLYQRARTDAAAEGDPALRRRQGQAYAAELAALCAPFLGMEAAPQRVMAERMTKHLRALFLFVADPAVPAAINAAERSLRHLVTCRKIGGGTRSPAGAATQMTLAFLFGAWRLQGRNPLPECHALHSPSQV